ncbi:MAG: hypothetical protein GY810_01640 [Aureispira sp.]|nr:hypothetical protein [Aureispira sp.]
MYISKGVVLIVLVLMYSVVGFCQESGVFTDAKVYTTKDIVKVNFFFKDKVVLYSNYGGCGGGVEYGIVCHSNEMYSQGSPGACDVGLMQYYYNKKGSIELPIQTPGVYSVLLYTKESADAESTDPTYTNIVYSERFEVKAKK